MCLISSNYIHLEFDVEIQRGSCIQADISPEGLPIIGKCSGIRRGCLTT